MEATATVAHILSFWVTYMDSRYRLAFRRNSVYRLSPCRHLHGHHRRAVMCRLIYANANRQNNKIAQWSPFGRQQACRTHADEFNAHAECTHVFLSKWDEECFGVEWIHRGVESAATHSHISLSFTPFEFDADARLLSFYFCFCFSACGVAPDHKQCCNKCLSWSTPRPLRHSAKAI